jgi:hypothetical protein
MDERPATRKGTIVAGIIAAVIGLYYMLLGAGVLWSPKDPNASPWVIFCAGLAFLLAGVAIVLQGAGHADANGELPAEAPQWQRVLHYLLALSIFVCLGAIASWVAFAPGPREFSGSVMGLEGPANPVIGRIAFGIGAVIIWLCTIAAAVLGARKLLSGSAGR